MAIKLQLKKIGKTFRGHKYKKTMALKDVHFSVKENEFVTLLGPSGCGKTTLINIIAELLTPTTGKIEIKKIKIA